MKKILLTGVNGFIGRNLYEYFGEEQMTAPNHSQMNLLDEKQVRNILEEGNFDIVLHAATSKSSNPREVLEDNLHMFYNLENCSDLYGKMIYFGSGAEYDMKHYIPCMEEKYFGTHIPKDGYGFSKYLMSRTTEYANNIVDLRLFGVYGKYEDWSRRFISNNICRILCGQPMTIEKNVFFDYLYIDDLCRILEWFITHDTVNSHYNVCTSQRIDLLSIAQMIRQVSGVNTDIIVKEDGYKLEYSGDNTRLIQEMGTFKFTEMMDAIETMWIYYQEHILEMNVSL